MLLLLAGHVVCLWDGPPFPPPCEEEEKAIAESVRLLRKTTARSAAENVARLSEWYTVPVAPAERALCGQARWKRDQHACDAHWMCSRWPGLAIRIWQSAFRRVTQEGSGRQTGGGNASDAQAFAARANNSNCQFAWPKKAKQNNTNKQRLQFRKCDGTDSLSQGAPPKSRRDEDIRSAQAIELPFISKWIPLCYVCSRKVVYTHLFILSMYSNESWLAKVTGGGLAQDEKASERLMQVVQVQRDRSFSHTRELVSPSTVVDIRFVSLLPVALTQTTHDHPCSGRPTVSAVARACSRLKRVMSPSVASVCSFPVRLGKQLQQQCSVSWVGGANRNGRPGGELPVPSTSMLCARVRSGYMDDGLLDSLWSSPVAMGTLSWT